MHSYGFRPTLQTARHGLIVLVVCVCNPCEKGKHFLDSYDLDSFRSPKLKYNYKNFCDSKDPDPSIDDWTSWKRILTNKRHPEGIPLAAINISKKNNKGYGTSSSSIIAIPSDKEKYNNNSKPIFLFNSGPPEKNNFYSITT